MRTASAFSLSSFSIHNIRSSLRMDSEACASSSRSWVLASASLVNLDVSSSTRDVSSAILVTSCIFKASSLLRSELISISAASLDACSASSPFFRPNSSVSREIRDGLSSLMLGMRITSWTPLVGCAALCADAEAASGITVLM